LWVVRINAQCNHPFDPKLVNGQGVGIEPAPDNPPRFEEDV
jgi:hypothetical protein